MQGNEFISSALEYIEANLKTDITAEELASMANYSTYHYYRLFSSAVGLTVSEYILSRRLNHALAEIADGRKAIDVVLEYGFDTYAGFYKAFVKMFGCSPKKYLSIYQKRDLKKLEVKEMPTKEQAQAILSNWDVNLPIQDFYYVIDKPILSDNEWMVGEEYFLKTDSREVILKEINILKTAAKYNAPIAKLVSTKTGEDYVDGEQIFMLRENPKGAPLKIEEVFGENRYEICKKYGKSLAQLHKALKEVEKDGDYFTGTLYPSVLEWALPSVQKQNAEFDMGVSDEFFAEYSEKFTELQEKMPRQLLHRDPGLNNVIFNDGEVTGFIHFPLSEIDLRLWDVCYAATGMLVRADSDEQYERWIDVLRGIAHGYDEENPLTSEEKQAIFNMICTIQMVCMASFGYSEFREAARKNREMFMYMIEKREEIESIF